MSGLRAFVGHSFTDEDADVVRKFLTYFEQVSKLLPDFTWDHAKQAEPTAISDKVLRLIEDKNLFICICTKKEAVVSIEQISKPRKRRIFDLLLPRSPQSLRNFTWKTSDWLIQEIGMAAGRRLKLILLIEDGVRKPGGLQGDVEYIQFTREHPEKSFGQISEMLGSIPRSDTQNVAAGTGKADNESEDTATALNTEHINDLTPDRSWDRRKYEIAYMRALITKKNEKAAEVANSFLNSANAEETESIQSWKAFEEFSRLYFGATGRLDRLKLFAETNPQNPDVLEYWAKGLRKFEQYSEAAGIFQAAANISQRPEQKLRFFGLAAVTYQQAGDEDSAIDQLEKMKRLNAQTEVIENEVLKTLYEISRSANNKDTELMALEGLIDLNPGDSATRFSVAHCHSQRGSHDLALSHYLRIPPPERNGMAWNNLGAAFQQADFEYKATSAYQEAIELGETLAMNNLAIKYLYGGFLAEAEALCKKALETPDFNERIGTTLSKIRTTPEEEDKRETELLIKSREKAAFYKKLGRALVRENTKSISGAFKGSECDLVSFQYGRHLRLRGEFYENRSSLTMLFIGDQNKQVKTVVDYEGKIFGGVVVGSVNREAEGQEKSSTKTLLSLGATPPEIFMVISEDKKSLDVMEISYGNCKFYTLSYVP